MIQNNIKWKELKIFETIIYDFLATTLTVKGYLRTVKTRITGVLDQDWIIISLHQGSFKDFQLLP